MVLSHIDNDHIIGLLDLLAAIRNQRESGSKELVGIKKILYNSFNELLKISAEPEKLLANIILDKNMEKSYKTSESLVMNGFQQGTDLIKLANLLKSHSVQILMG